MTAEERFKKLGYKKTWILNRYEEAWGECYINSDQLIEIEFDYEGQMVCTSCSDTGEPVYITTQELKAINLKVKELGWEE